MNTKEQSFKQKVKITMKLMNQNEINEQGIFKKALFQNLFYTNTSTRTCLPVGRPVRHCRQTEGQKIKGTLIPVSGYKQQLREFHYL